MNFALAETEGIKEDMAEESRRLNPPAPLGLDEIEVYWSIYRKTTRVTQKNKGWTFVTYYHATVKKMKQLIDKYGWYLPDFMVHPSNAFCVTKDEREKVMALASEICSPSYSEKNKGNCNE